MAGTFTRALLSGTPASGRVIPVAATATPGTLIHTAITGSQGFDEVYLWASNQTGSPAQLTIQWGGVTDPGDIVARTVVIPPKTKPILIIDGLTLNGGLIVRAYSDVANAINVSGHVNSII